MYTVYAAFLKGSPVLEGNGAKHISLPTETLPFQRKQRNAHVINVSRDFFDVSPLFMSITRIPYPLTITVYTGFSKGTRFLEGNGADAKKFEKAVKAANNELSR